jgi:hypothetical protein
VNAVARPVRDSQAFYGLPRIRWRSRKRLRQVQVNKKAGIDFAMVMRAFLPAGGPGHHHGG